VAASRPLFLFVFLVEYHTIDVPDDVVLIPFDPARGEALASPGSLLAALRGGTGEPAPGWPALPALPTAGDLQRVLDVLDRRLQRRARHVKEASALEIARETANIEAYYRQLIDEARHPLGRSVGGASDEGARVRLLQLDWKRRVQEVSRFWEARGDVRLSALGVVMEPAWVVPLLRRGARLRRGSPGRPYALVAGGRHGGLRCAVCGARLGRRAALHGTDLICLGHDGAPPAAAQA
jgi:hypothetical protein